MKYVDELGSAVAIPWVLLHFRNNKSLNPCPAKVQNVFKNMISIHFQTLLVTSVHPWILSGKCFSSDQLSFAIQKMLWSTPYGTPTKNTTQLGYNNLYNIIHNMHNIPILPPFLCRWCVWDETITCSMWIQYKLFEVLVSWSTPGIFKGGALIRI